jgi:hypothetical protein
MDEAHYHTWKHKANGRKAKSLFQNAANRFDNSAETKKPSETGPDGFENSNSR